MNDFLTYHQASSLTHDNKKDFSNIATWTETMKDFSKNLIIDVQDSITFPLINPELIDQGIGFSTVAKKRRSVRNFNNQAVSLEELSYILINSLSALYDSKKRKLFPYPQAGGIEGLFFLIVINNIKDLKQGLYYFNSSNNSLQWVSNFSRDDYKRVTASEELAVQSAFSIHVFGRYTQKSYKYQERSYRFLLQETGHVGQMIYLTATAINIGCVASGGYLDNIRSWELDFLDDKQDLILYEFFLGHY